MRNNLSIYELKESPIKCLEIVERKGLGHPDTICDSIMNECSVNLCKEYLDNFGDICHHNIDKALLAAGETETRFGGGKVVAPMLLVFGDRATYSLEGTDIDVDGICVSTAKNWIRKNLRFVNPVKHLKYQIELKKGSDALTDIFSRKGKVLGANDTSAAVGYAPMSPTERTVLELEEYLNSDVFKKEFPETGEDIKIMGIRENSSLNLTVAMAFVDQYVPSENHYFKKKEEILEKIGDRLKDLCKKYAIDINFEISLNELDKRGRGEDGTYLTVLGTSADGADSGQVGRGNKVNGIIPLNRFTGSEAAAGKNPVSHVGKIYSVLTHKIAEQVYKDVSGLKEVYVWLVSGIGQPIDQPKKVSVQVVLDRNVSLRDLEKEIDEVVNHELGNINEFCMNLALGKMPIC